MFMKEYGLDGVLYCDGVMMDLDVPMLEFGTDAKQAKFKVEQEKSKCVSVECSNSLPTVLVFQSDGSPKISMSYSIPQHEFLLVEKLGPGVLTNCRGDRVAYDEKLAISDAPYLFTPCKPMALVPFQPQDSHSYLAPKTPVLPRAKIGKSVTL